MRSSASGETPPGAALQMPLAEEIPPAAAPTPPAAEEPPAAAPEDAAGVTAAEAGGTEKKEINECAFCKQVMIPKSTGDAELEALPCGHVFHVGCVRDYCEAVNISKSSCCPDICHKSVGSSRAEIDAFVAASVAPAPGSTGSTVRGGAAVGAEPPLVDLHSQSD